ncbi:histone deacetylase [Rhodobacteraceae bacterium NNCM2]|nr:histone deacetylase [Coraliihabitans acroporae]
MLPIVHHPHYQIPLREGHRFPMSKYGYLREILLERGLLERGRYPAPAMASIGQLGLAHDPGYVERVTGQTLTPAETRVIGLPNQPDVARRARLSSAGTLLAAWLALETGLACNSAGGSHHARREAGSGFCVFNDVGVAAMNLIAQGFSGAILVVDADVHQGDGTARIFEENDQVFTFSIHSAKNFPARKAISNLDVPLPDKMEDDAYLTALEAGLVDAIRASRPRLAFYNAGVDVWENDRLGRLALTMDGIRARERLVLSVLRGADIPVCTVIGGGYGDNPEVAGRHAILFEEAAKLVG